MYDTEQLPPTERNAAAKVTGSPFWMMVIGFWLVLGIVAVTLALGLAIWNLIEAF